MTAPLVARRARAFSVLLACVALAATALVARSGAAGAQSDDSDGATNFAAATDFDTSFTTGMDSTPPPPVPRSSGGRGGIAINIPIGFPPGNVSPLALTGADLAVTVTDPLVPCGRPNPCEEFTITVTNLGPDAAVNTTMQNSVSSPPGTNAFIVSVSTPSGTCQQNEQEGGSTTASCSLGTLPPGGSATIHKVVALDCQGSERESAPVTDTATAFSQTPDPNPANNTASASADVPCFGPQ